MSLNFHDYSFKYTSGVPQGSVLSPVLFNLVYDKLLKEAHNFGWYILAYADDLFIGIKNITEYQKVLSWLESWKSKTNLTVNNGKTKEFRLGKYRHTIGKFEKVDSFVYLGVEVVPTKIFKLAKTRCRKAIDNSVKFSHIIRNINPKSNFFVYCGGFYPAYFIRLFMGFAVAFMTLNMCTHIQ